MKDLTGLKFGRLKVIKYSHKDEKNSFWKCRCDCGKIKIISKCNFKSVKSCGCLKKEINHGLSEDPLYGIAKDQKSRCENKNDKKYNIYGGRGIKFKFNSLQEAVKYYKTLGPKPGHGYSLDREDNDGNYEVDNMRWLDLSGQALNRSVQKNKIHSKFRGVSFVTDQNLWRTRIAANGKSIYIGKFRSELAAAEAYLNKYFELHQKWPPEYSKTPLCYKTPLHHLGLIK